MNKETQDYVVNATYYKRAFFVLLFLLVARIIAMIYVPLNDSTEARYGEIARKMLETGNWITPLHDYTIPFWAKPPLSFWLSALSMKCFGIHEFAARLPALLLSIAVIWMIWSLVRKHSQSVSAILSMLVLSSSLFFYLNSGTVMTDPALVFCTTLSFVAFWRAVVWQQRIWSYLFFVGLGLGLLAKGPIAVVLTCLPLVFWISFYRQWGVVWNRLPWFWGSLLTLLIALPWYALAEYRTPGFLNYFIVGEHLNRFLKPAWAGDRYGMAHDAHWGMIWVYAAAGIFPWCFLGLQWMLTFWRRIPEFSKGQNGWIGYQLFGCIIPLLFFSFSSNIIYTYVIPILPAFAILFSEWWVKTWLHSRRMMYLMIWAASLTGIAFLVITAVFVFYPGPIIKSHKPVLALWQEQHPNPQSKLYYWEYKTQYSAQFYGRGRVQAVQSISALCGAMDTKEPQYVVIYDRDLNHVGQEFLSRLEAIQNITINGEGLKLFMIPVGACAIPSNQ